MQRSSCESSGLSLSYLEWPAVSGAADVGDLIVLVHGFLDLGHSMVGVVEALREQRVGARVVAPDWRGHGESGWVGPGGYYHFVDYVADLSVLVDHLAPDAPSPGHHVFVVGHSMGGTASSYFAGTFPERLSGLVNIEGLGPPADTASNAAERTRSWAVAWRQAAARRFKRASLTLQEAGQRLRRMSPGLTEEAALELAGHATRDDGNGARQWKFDPLHQTPGAIPFNVEQASAYWRNVTVPVLFVEGSDSPFRELPDLPQRRACFARRQLRLIDGAGHMVHHDRPAELARLIAGFTVAVRSGQFAPDP
jgi:pimeloyl-ACP methyl ester carboxylesterase